MNCTSTTFANYQFTITASLRRTQHFRISLILTNLLLLTYMTYMYKLETTNYKYNGLDFS